MYASLGVPLLSQTPASSALTVLNDYVSNGMGFFALQNVAQDTVTLLLSGNPGNVMMGGKVVANVPAHPEIAAIFGSHEQTARILAATVLETLIYHERQKTTGRTPLDTLAQFLVAELIAVFNNGGDPFACESLFESSFRDWAALSNLQVPKSMSATGWCQKSISLPVNPDGSIASCQAQSICRSYVPTPNGKIQFYSAPPPAPSDLSVSVQTPGNVPVPPPTKEDIQAAIQKKMATTGQSLEEVERQTEFIELAAYLKSVAESRLWLGMALGLPEKSTDQDVVRALATRGISSGEALDWFDGCDFDPNCFREEMNRALGESANRARDQIAKTAVVAVAGLAAFMLWRWTR
jgi:hypothetical protein